LLTDTQQLILKSLVDGERTLAEISRLTSLSKPNLQTQLSQLEKRGLVSHRKVSPKRILYRTVGKEILERWLKGLESDIIAKIFKPPSMTQTQKPVLVAGFDLQLTPSQQAFLETQFTFTQYSERDDQMTPELFLLRYKNAQIALIIASFTFLTADLLRQCQKLKHVIYLGKFGQEYIDTRMVKQLGMTFWDLSHPDTNFIRSASTEFLLASLLSLLRLNPQPEQEIKLTGMSNTGNYFGEEIYGKTIGFIGIDYSTIASAPLLRQLGADLLFADPDNKRHDLFQLGVESLTSVPDLFTTADIVIYTDTYYKQTPDLSLYLTSSMHTKYLLMLGEYPYDKEFMMACRAQILSRGLKGLHIDYWSMKRYTETPAQRLKLLSDVIYFPNVHVTPFLGPSSLQTVSRRNDYAVKLLREMKEVHYAA
jgi:DNA-binding MarR family transcriptional regulator